VQHVRTFSKANRRFFTLVAWRAAQDDDLGIPSFHRCSGPIKRARSTKAAVEKRRSDLCDIIAEMQSMTVRQVFYQATVRGIIEKAESGYAKVQTELTLMRRKDLALSTREAAS
jgi:hypothetical protein